MLIAYDSPWLMNAIQDQPGGTVAEHRGPYLQIALICEKALQEQDGILSLIRIIDRVMITATGPTAPVEMPPSNVQVTLVLGFKSGEARGSHTVVVRPEAPSGLRMPEVSLPVLFEGEDRGQNVILGLALQVEHQGLYWFDVLLDDALITRVPLRIVYQRLSFGT